MREISKDNRSSGPKTRRGLGRAATVLVLTMVSLVTLPTFTQTASAAGGKRFTSSNDGANASVNLGCHADKVQVYLDNFGFQEMKVQIYDSRADKWVRSGWTDVSDTHWWPFKIQKSRWQNVAFHFSFKDSYGQVANAWVPMGTGSGPFLADFDGYYCGPYGPN